MAHKAEESPAASEKFGEYTAGMFEESDTLTAVLARIHDAHLDVINKREDEFKAHLMTWLLKTLEEFLR